LLGLVDRDQRVVVFLKSLLTIARPLLLVVAHSN